jgi:lysyl-tRNA synthetase class 1
MVELVQNSPRGAENKFIREKLEQYNYLKDTDNGLDDRITRAMNWVEDFDESSITLPELNEDEITAVKEVISELQKAENEEDYQAVVFNVSKTLNMKPRILFPLLYQILLGRNQGPRFGPYVSLVGKNNVIKELQAIIK